MKTFAVSYYEGRNLVCWIVKAKTREEADTEFHYALAAGEIENFNYKKGIVSIDECH